MDLVVATTNAGKLKEIQALLDGAPVRLYALADIPGFDTGDEPEETGATFAENAVIKAEAYAARIGRWDPLESTCRHASLSIL